MAAPYGCPGCDLSGHSFAGQDLTGADLHGAKLAGADFRGAKFGNTNFAGCDLTASLFDPRPDFGADPAQRTSFAGATLPFALLGKTWRCLDLTGATFVGMPDDLTFLSVSGCQLPGFAFGARNLGNAHFTACLLRDACFAGTRLTNAVFAGQCDLSRASFAGADLMNAVLDTSTLTDADFRGAASLQATSLLQTRMDGTDFSGLDVTSCAFSAFPRVSSDPARLTRFQGATLKLDAFKRQWSYLDLRGATLVGLAAGVDLGYLQARYANLSGWDLSGYALANADFTGARLDGSRFVGATLTGATFNGAQGLRPRFDRAALDGAGFGLDHDRPALLPGACFDGATLTAARFPRAGLGLADPADTHSGASFLGASLSSVDFSQADLTGAQMPGVALHHAILTNATLAGANLAGAQLGSLSELFRLASGSAEYQALSSALQQLALDGVRAAFALRGVALSPGHTALANDVPGRAWSLDDQAAHVKYAVVMRVFSDASVFLVASSVTTAATLTGAYMPGAILTDANLYAAEAPGIQFYGAASKLDGSVPLDFANLSNANLGSLNMQGALLYGAVLSYASLINACLKNAKLLPAAAGSEASLAYAQLQGACFTDAELAGADMSNAAVSTELGVYLFGSSGPQAAAIAAELTAAASRQVVLSTDGARIAAVAAALGAGDLRPARPLLAACHVAFSPSAVVTTVDPGAAWLVTDASPPAGQPGQYALFSGHDVLGDAALLGRPELAATRTWLAAGEIALRAAATVSVSGPGGWSIDNDKENPKNLQLGYVQLSVVEEPDGSLSAYGTGLHVQRLADRQQLRIELVTFKPTLLCAGQGSGTPCVPDGSSSYLGPDTKCPNTRYLSDNQKDGVPWAKMLRSPAPPRPPRCVPSPFADCPQQLFAPPGRGLKPPGSAG